MTSRSSIKVNAEINRPQGGGVLLVGRDPGKDEIELGRPFVGQAGMVFDNFLRVAGLMREEVNITNCVPYKPYNNEFRNHSFETVSEGLKELRELIRELQPDIIVALGNEAAWATTHGWPDHNNWITTATGINERRGYFFPSIHHDGWVLATLHPANVGYKIMPASMLLELDARRLHDWLAGKLPRETFPPVEIARSYAQLERLKESGVLACDIETRWNSTELLCIGFCGDDLRPLVVPHENTAMCLDILASDQPLVFHHGQYDVYMLQEKEGIRVRGFEHDTMFQHWALYPELASKEETGGEYADLRKAQKMTRKGLAVLAGMRYNVPWWKNYGDEEDPSHYENMMELCGRDCYITRRLHTDQMAEIEELDVGYQYRQRIRLLPVAIAMQKRGLPVNDELRKERIEKLKERGGALLRDITLTGLDYIWENQLEAFRKQGVCRCCRGGLPDSKRKSKKAKACWSCAGFEKAPGKKELVEALGTPDCSKMKKAELEAMYLEPCKICNGKGYHTWYEFNPMSGQQMITLLEAIGVPKTVWGGSKKQADETTMNRILAWARGTNGKIVEL